MDPQWNRSDLDTREMPPKLQFKPIRDGYTVEFVPDPSVLTKENERQNDKTRRMRKLWSKAGKSLEREGTTVSHEERFRLFLTLLPKTHPTIVKCISAIRSPSDAVVWRPWTGTLSQSSTHWGV